MSNERVLIIRAYGGEIRLTPAAEGILGAIEETERLAAAGDVFLPRQFANLDNAQAHRVATAREILDQIPGATVDGVVSGVGTGGTLVGLFQGFRDAGCRVRPYLAKPVALTPGAAPDVECCSFSGRIPGVVDRISKIFREEELPGLETVEVRDEQALDVTRRLMNSGYPVGPSSGLNFVAALEAMKRLGDGARVVTVFPDRMERYFTTDLFKPFRS